MAIGHGASLKRLSTVKHGQISRIQHHGTDLFQDIGSIQAVRYHSLHVELEMDGPVKELAWAEDEENGKVLMAARHANRPFWAVQYHPESVCTDDGGLQIVRNFWSLAQQWSKRVGRRTLPWNSSVGGKLGCSWPYAPSSPTAPDTTNHRIVLSSSLHRRDLSIVDICEVFGASQDSRRFVLLESASQPGRFSIVGSVSASTIHLQYHIGDSSIAVARNGKTVHENLGSSDVWSWLAKFMKARKVMKGNSDLPFWGGLIGYMSYEIGVLSLQVPLKRTEKVPNGKHPDLNFVFVERSVIVDSETGKVHVQSIAPNDTAWIKGTVAMLDNISAPQSPTLEAPIQNQKPTIIFPDKTQYISRIRQAKEHLFAGDSYEICLTAQTRIFVPTSPLREGSSTSWERYKRLRQSNPAPHSAYLRLHPTTLLSSSPERFLSYTRPPGTLCQLRPIKGTIRKAPHITRAVAEQALIGSPKEVAENLMIVDLIRHDLHGVVGEGVQVKQFCSVEEYETVWQLVSVIEGSLSDEAILSGAEEQLGWEVLKRSLPPGRLQILTISSHISHFLQEV